MKKLFSVFLLLLINCNSAQSRRLAQENLTAYPWQFIAPMPHGRYGHDAVYAANGKIYVMGGLVFKVAKGFKNDGKFNSWLVAKYNNGRYSNLAYDPKTDEWEYMTSIPGIIHDDYITFYYPGEDKWVEKKGNVWELKEEKIKLFQELKKSSGKKKTRIYETDFIRQGNGVAITTLKNDMLLWLGGGDFLGNIANIALPYSLKEDNWPGLVRKEYKFIPGVVAKTIYETDQREMYQTDIPSMQEPRRDHRAVTTADGKIYVLGGWRKEKIGVNPEKGTYLKEVDVVSRTMECYDPQTNKWEYKKPLSRERMVFAAVTGKDDKIYIFGGVAGFALDQQVAILNTVEVYDPKTDTWSFRKPMPVKLSGHCAVLATDGKIYIMGGAETYDDVSASVLIYDPEKDNWEKGPDMILPRASLAAVATPDGKIYAIGGTDVEAYEDKTKWQHLVDLFSSAELGGYNGKVQDSVEVLDVNAWNAAQAKKKK